uniref:Uncharacterized protein n=1 Tax=Arundo donax TaxID=35708 RepID=A0A0A9BXQ2_ARUDO
MALESRNLKICDCLAIGWNCIV